MAIPDYLTLRTTDHLLSSTKPGSQKSIGESVPAIRAFHHTNPRGWSRLFISIRQAKTEALLGQNGASPNGQLVTSLLDYEHHITEPHYWPRGDESHKVEL